MRVGILSMQQITNYGSFLQAYGLRSIVEQLGHEVEFVNIVPGPQLTQYRITKLHKVKLMLKRLRVRHPLRQLQSTIKLHKRFNNEFKPELGVKDYLTETRFDVVIIGSDEVFNVAQTTWFGFSPQLFGEGLNTDRVISYAGCFGATTIETLKELGIDKKISNLLKKIDAISVRDINSVDVVTSLIHKKPSLNIDPVIAYSFQTEIRHPNIKEDFLLVYTYPQRMNDPNEIKTITYYARSRNLKIISIANYFDWVDEVVIPHPFEVLGYFKRAKCIVTDTFHGAVMSLKFNKQFAVIVRAMNNNKLTFLLDQFGLSSRIAHEIVALQGIIDTPINYSNVNKKIEEEREKTLVYLKRNIK